MLIFTIKLVILHMDLSKNILKIRESKGIRQYDIAERLGIDAPNYSRLEKRGDKLTIEQLKKIADVLDCTIGDLLGESVVNKNYLSQIGILEEKVLKRDELIKSYIKTIDIGQKYISSIERVDDAYNKSISIKEEIILSLERMVSIKEEMILNLESQIKELKLLVNKTI